MSETWVITSWSVPYADKRFALFWLANDIEKRDFARNRTGAVRTFVSRTSAPRNQKSFEQTISKGSRSMQQRTSQLTEEQENNAHAWEEPVTDETEPLQEEADAENQHVYHVYIVKEPETEQEIPPFVAASPSAPKHKRRSVLLLVMVCIAILATLSGMATGALLLTPTVTVTIIPEQKALTTITTLILVSDKPQTPDQIPGRLLPVLTMSQQQTVNTTGMGQQPAQYAQGKVTLYNAAPFAQTIPAGTLLTAANNLHVVIDEEAILPAADMPLVGQATVAAHAVVSGQSGNIPAFAINGACCRVNVFVKNLRAFTGGQEARQFPMVTQHDSDSVAVALKTSLLQSIQAALHTQIKTYETLVTPLSCTATVTPDHPVGAEATELTVTVSQTCKPVAYETRALQTRIAAIQEQESLKQFGGGYRLMRVVQTTITKVSQAKQGLFNLTIQATGTWAYQFNQEHLQRIKQQLVGKNREQATAILLQVSGVKQVSLGEIAAALPTDPGKIEIAVLYPPGSQIPNQER